MLKAIFCITHFDHNPLYPIDSAVWERVVYSVNAIKTPEMEL